MIIFLFSLKKKSVSICTLLDCELGIVTIKKYMIKSWNKIHITELLSNIWGVPKTKLKFFKNQIYYFAFNLMSHVFFKIISPLLITFFLYFFHFWKLFWGIICADLIRHFLLPLLSFEINNLTWWISSLGTKNILRTKPSELGCWRTFI